MIIKHILLQKKKKMIETKFHFIYLNYIYRIEL